MKLEVVMPRLGVNDDQVTLVSWLVNDGDSVVKGQAVAEIETSKESSELKAVADGMISLRAEEGEDIDVGAVIALMETSDPEAVSSEEAVNEAAETVVSVADNKKEKPKEAVPAYVSGIKGNEIILYGGGGFAEIAIDILKVTHAFNVTGIVDINYPEFKELMGIPVLGGDESLKSLYEKGYHNIFNCVNGDQIYRKPVYEKLKSYGFNLPNIVHMKAITEPSSLLGEGTIVCAGAIVGAHASIGNNCVINAGSIISHDCVIGDHCHIASGAVLAGFITVGENTLIGQNVSIYSRVKIGSNVTIQNGCSVFKDVPDNTVIRYGK